MATDFSDLYLFCFQIQGVHVGGQEVCPALRLLSTRKFDFVVFV